MAAPVDGASGPQSRRRDRILSSPWANVVRGESDMPAVASSTAAAISVGPEAGVNSDRGEKVNSPVEGTPGSSDDNSGNVGAAKARKPAWNKPINGVVEVGPVMGAVSWPALSESTRAVPKSSSDGKALANGSVSVPPEPVIASSPQNAFTNNANPNSTSNHPLPVRQKSMKRGERGTGNGGLDPTQSPSMAAPQSASTSASPPTMDLSPRDFSHRGSGNAEGQAVPRSYNGNDQQRYPYRRGIGGPRPRGDGHFPSNHGGRRDQERSNELNLHRNFNGADVYMPQPRPAPRGFARPPPPPPAPFIAPPRQFSSPLDMASPIYYVPAPHPDSFRGVQFVPHPVPPPMFFARPEPPLHVKLLMQIEYYFSFDNLLKDTYLRRKMDNEGWVPISLIAGFKRVQLLTSNIQIILDALRTSNVVEVQGDKIRRREDWKRWPIPPNDPPYDRFGSSAFNPPSYTVPSHVTLSTQIQNIRLEDGLSNPSSHTKKEGQDCLPSSSQSSNPAVVTGTSNGVGASQQSSLTGKDLSLST